MCKQQDENDKKETATTVTPLETTSLLTENNKQKNQSNNTRRARQTMMNFIFFAILFSIHHGTIIACLHLASARLGDVGAWQSGTLYITYTFSALFGASAVVMALGSRDAVIAGMAIYCTYVGCFYLATTVPSLAGSVSIVGAAIGGVGGGFLWTAQGAYFARTSEEYAVALLSGSNSNDCSSSNNNNNNNKDKYVSDATSLLGGIFAFIYLTGEVALGLLSTFLVKIFGLSWSRVYGVYFTIAVLSAYGMFFVEKYEQITYETQHEQHQKNPNKKTTAAIQLLLRDPKMKYMVGLNAAFGFTSAFFNSFVFGEVLHMSSYLKNPSAAVGVLASVTASVAAVMSILFGKIACITGKGFVLTIGAMSFFLVAFLFVTKPNADNWGWLSLLCISAFQSVGRATFEGTLRATFADFFPHQKEGAFANIIVQSGLSSVMGFWLSVNLPCQKEGTYCVEFRDGALHNTLSFELIIMVTSFLGILGFWRANHLHKKEMRRDESLPHTQISV